MMAHARWYCGVRCADTDPTTQGLRDLHNKGIEFYKREDSYSSSDIDPDDFEL